MGSGRASHCRLLLLLRAPPGLARRRALTRLPIHPKARTTPTTRADIARSEEATGVLARRERVRAETIRPWPQRGGKEGPDHAARPPQRPGKATEEERAIVCALRRSTNWALDDLTCVVTPFLPPLQRDSSGRIRKAEGRSRHPRPVSSRPVKGAGTFQEYDLGLIHMDSKPLPPLQTGNGERGQRYLSVALDRCARSVHGAVQDEETEKSAIALRPEAATAVPFRLPPV